MPPYHTIIIGLGAMGSAAAYHLAKRNVKVLGLDQFSIPHDKGSSHGHSRMIRMAYYEHPHYVPLLRRAYELWHELDKDAGEPVLHITGGLYMGPPSGPVVHGTLEAAKLHGLPHALLDRAQMRRLFPHFTIPEGYVCVSEPKAGLLLSEKAIGRHATAALLHGAELHGHEPVFDWTSTDNGVSVRTPRDTYHAERLVFCAGAWTGKLLADLGVSLVVTRQILAWVWPRRSHNFFRYGVMPVWGIEQPDGSLAYGFPMMPDHPGFKLARHAPGLPTDPDRLDRNTTADDEREIREILQRYLPDADGPLLSLRTCMYTNSPDHHFIIDRHPRHDNVFLAAGFSGHGFKFASVIGEILADLAQHDRTNHPIDFLSLRRFAAKPSA
jgi:sarcosine oxidase